MRKLVLSLSVALASLFVLANVAMAQDWSSQAQYKVNVMGTDDISGAQGVWMGRWTDELADRWQRTYGWNPTLNTTIYLYTSGESMAMALGDFRGSPLTETEMREVAVQETAFTGMDMRPAASGGTGDRFILVNLNNAQFGPGIGSANWMREVKVAVVQELAELMMMDVAGPRGPIWLRVGIADYLTLNEVPDWQVPVQRNMALDRITSAGIAPGIVALHDRWNGITRMSTAMRDASYAIATKTVQTLVPRTGLNAFLTLLRDSQRGGDYSAKTLRNLGYDLSQLDLMYRMAQ